MSTVAEDKVAEWRHQCARELRDLAAMRRGTPEGRTKVGRAYVTDLLCAANLVSRGVSLSAAKSAG